MTELRERLARAMFDVAPFRDSSGTYDEQSETYRRLCNVYVSAILTELEAAGWPPVPEEATIDMVMAGANTMERLASLFSAAIGKRLTYAELIA